MGGTDPWEELGAREDVDYRVAPVPFELQALCWPRSNGRTAIVIDPALTQDQKRAALCHELEHLKKGGGASWMGQPATWDAVVVRDESRVDDVVARRLVPLAELAELLAAMDDMAHTPDLWEIAEHFGVPESTAARALSLLARERWGERSAG